MADDQIKTSAISSGKSSIPGGDQPKSNALVHDSESSTGVNGYEGENTQAVNHRRVVLLVFIVAAFFILIVQSFYWWRVNPWLEPDAPRYITIAKSILNLDYEHAIHFHYPPLFPLVIAAFITIIDSPENAARVSGIFIALLTLIPVYALAKRIFNIWAACLALFFFAFKFHYLYLGGHAEPLLNLLLYSALAVGLAATRGRKVTIFLAGFLFGLAALAKPEALAFFILWFGMLFIRLIALRARFSEVLRFCVLCWAGYLLVVSPYLSAYYIESGRLSLNPKGRSLFILHNEPDWGQASYGLRTGEQGLYTLRQRIDAGRDRTPLDVSIPSYAWTHRARLVRTYFSRLRFTLIQMIPAYLRVLLAPSALVCGIIILTGILARSMKKNAEWLMLYLLSFGVLSVLIVPLFRPEMRFFSNLVPLLVILLAAGAERISHIIAWIAIRLRGNTSSSRWLLIITCVFALLFVTPDVYFLAKRQREVKFPNLVEDRKHVAEWLRSNLPPDKNIMSSGSYMPLWYLAGIFPERDIVLPLAGIDQVIAYARQEQVLYIVMDNDYSLKRYPDLAPLLSQDFRHPELERVFYWNSIHGRLYVIYRLKA